MNTEILNQKIEDLIKAQEENLNTKCVVYATHPETKNLHVLFYRKTDNSYIVWTSYYKDNEVESFEGFYSGAYDMNFDEGMLELERRTGRMYIMGNWHAEHTKWLLGQSNEYKMSATEYISEQNKNDVNKLINDAAAMVKLASETIKLEEKRIVEDLQFKVLNRFFDECLSFWTRDLKEKQVDLSERYMVVLALNDCIKLEYNPFSPFGEPINKEIHEAWLTRKLQLYSL